MEEQFYFPSKDANACDTCKAFSISAVRTEEGFYHRNVAGLMTSASNGCNLCELLRDVILQECRESGNTNMLVNAESMWPSPGGAGSAEDTAIRSIADKEEWSLDRLWLYFGKGHNRVAEIFFYTDDLPGGEYRVIIPCRVCSLFNDILKRGSYSLRREFLNLLPQRKTLRE